MSQARARDVFLAVSRDGDETLTAQVERQIRDAVREGRLVPGTRLPSTRALASQLGVSRRVAIEAYDQLAAGGFVSLRQGAAPRVAAHALPAQPAPQRPAARAAPVRYDFSISLPDVAAFPRSAWVRAVRVAMAELTEADLTYCDPHGLADLRSVLSDYLGRVRAVLCTPEQIVVTNGFTQGLGLVLQVLAARGARAVAFEDPGDPDAREVAARAGLRVAAVPVDDAGMRVDRLAALDVDAVVVTPAHQHPLGVVLSRERRAELAEWLRAGDRYAIEDDYDAEYRFDRSPVGALQGLAPERVVYAGSASKTLAPALRLGWLVLPETLRGAVGEQKRFADRGTSTIEQRALAEFVERGELDRHLRRMRQRYRGRRDALVAAVGADLPGTAIRGIAAGLHATVELPGAEDAVAIAARALARGVRVTALDALQVSATTAPPTLLLGYAHLPEETIGAGVRVLAEAIAGA